MEIPFFFVAFFVKKSHQSPVTPCFQQGGTGHTFQVGTLMPTGSLAPWVQHPGQTAQPRCGVFTHTHLWHCLPRANCLGVSRCFLIACLICLIGKLLATCFRLMNILYSTNLENKTTVSVCKKIEGKSKKLKSCIFRSVSLVFTCKHTHLSCERLLWTQSSRREPVR